MNRRQLAILAVVAVAFLVVGILVKRSGPSNWESGTHRIGTPLVEDLPLNEVAGARLTDAEGTVTVARKEGTWCVKQRYDYPADYGRISQFVKQLANERVKQVLEVEENHYGRLNLRPPRNAETQGTGMEVELQSEDGEPLAVVRLGKQHTRVGETGNPMQQQYPDGRYILLPHNGEAEVLLVANAFRRASAQPVDWLDKQFVELRNVVEASLERNGETVWRLVTDPEEDRLTLAGDVDEAFSVRRSAVSSTARALAYNSFEDVADPQLDAEATGLDSPAVYRAVNEDHVACTLRLGARTEAGACYATVELAYAPPPSETERSEQEEGGAPTEEDEAAAEGEENEQKEIAAKTRKLNETLSGWTYLLPKSMADKLLRERSDFLEEASPDEESAGNQNPETGVLPPPPPSPETVEPPDPPRPPDDADAAGEARAAE